MLYFFIDKGCDIYMELEFIDNYDINLKFARGDQFPVDFKIKDKDGDYISGEDVEDIVVTCRMFPDSESEMLFQKKMSNGFVEYDSIDELFEFFILEEDTRDLNYGHYGYEIKVVTEEETRTFTGHIDVADEYTVGVIKKNFYLVDLEVTPTTDEQVFTHEESIGYDTVTVSGVDASVDSNIIPENIKKGIEILGVEGTCESGGTEAKVEGTILVLGNVTVENEEVII